MIFRGKIVQLKKQKWTLFADYIYEGSVKNDTNKTSICSNICTSRRSRTNNPSGIKYNSCLGNSFKNTKIKNKDGAGNLSRRRLFMSCCTIQHYKVHLYLTFRPPNVRYSQFLEAVSDKNYSIGPNNKLAQAS